MKVNIRSASHKIANQTLENLKQMVKEQRMLNKVEISIALNNWNTCGRLCKDFLLQHFLWKSPVFCTFSWKNTFDSELCEAFVWYCPPCYLLSILRFSIRGVLKQLFGVVTRHIFASLNRYGRPNVEPNFFSLDFSWRCQ